MKKILFTSIIFILFYLKATSVFSQNSNIMGIMFETTKTDSVGVAGDTLYDIEATVFVMDTVSTDKLKLKIGNTSGGAEYFLAIYNWDNNSVTTNYSCTVTRLGAEVKFSIKGVVYDNSYFTSYTLNNAGSQTASYTTQ